MLSTYTLRAGVLTSAAVAVIMASVAFPEHRLREEARARRRAIWS